MLSEQQESNPPRQFLPCVEQPARCFFSSDAHDKRLSSTKDGRVLSSKKRSNQESFILIPQENNTVLIQSFRDHRFLRCGAVSSKEQVDLVLVGETSTEGETEASTTDDKKDAGLWDRSPNVLAAETSTEGETAVSKADDKKDASLWNHASEMFGSGTSTEREREASTTAVKKDSSLWNRASKMLEKRASTVGQSAVSTTEDKGDADPWRLEKAANGGFYVHCMNDNTYLACDEEGNITLINEKEQNWTVEFQTGELCFVSSPGMDKRVRCNLAGSLSLSENWKGWEVWRFIEADGDGYVRLSAWMHHNHYLCSNANGNVFTSTNPQEEDGTLWMVEQDAGGHGVIIQSAVHKRVLCCDNETLFTDPHGGAFGVWQLEAAHRQKYYLSSAVDNKSIGSFPYVTDDKRQVDEWELEKHGDTVTFFSPKNGQYLECTGDGNVCLTPVGGADEPESWDMETRPDGGCAFRSAKHSQYLSWIESGEKEGTLCTVATGTSERETWRLEPCMPRAVSGGKIKTIAIGAGAAIATAVAMPFVAAGVIGLIGAEAGVLADIVIVGLTGAEAIESVVVVGITAALVFKESGDSFGSKHGEPTEEDNVKPFAKRPFAAIGGGKWPKQPEIL